jgi:hypothetical protein
MTETIVAAYDRPAHAEQVIADLLAAHVPAERVHRHSRDGDDMTREVLPVVVDEGPGFWASLFGVADVGEDHLAYDHTLDGGGTVVRVTMIPDQDYDTVLQIMERHHPVDMDAHGAEHGVGAAAAGGDTRQAAERLVHRGTARVRHYIADKPE